MSGLTAAVAFALHRHEATRSRTSAGTRLIGESDSAVYYPSTTSSPGRLMTFLHPTPRVAVVGFDDFELAEMLEVPATVVAYDPAELGRRAAQLLCARIGGDERPPQRVVVPTHLVLRGSGEVKP